MELPEAIALLKYKSLSDESPSCWADLGCGDGLFSFALGNLLPAGSTIYAIDRESIPLRKLSYSHQVQIHQLQLDFASQPLPFSNLDGFLMANSLHFVADKADCIAKLIKYLKPDGSFLLVEYNTDMPNPWVPFPIGYHSLFGLFGKLGFTSIEKLGERPSKYGRATMYAVLVRRQLNL